MSIPKDMDFKDTMGHTPSGRIYVVDPSPLNWLYVLFNTMEEAVRADFKGKIIQSLASGFQWIEDTTLEIKLRKGVYYHNNEPFTSRNFAESFYQMQLWIAPHPPGTWLNFPKETTLEVLDDYTVRLHFPRPEGLALGKFRADHLGNSLFWKTIGFGYAKLGTGEGHW